MLIIFYGNILDLEKKLSIVEKIKGILWCIHRNIEGKLEIFI